MVCVPPAGGEVFRSAKAARSDMLTAKSRALDDAADATSAAPDAAARSATVREIRSPGGFRAEAAALAADDDGTDT